MANPLKLHPPPHPPSHYPSPFTLPGTSVSSFFRELESPDSGQNMPSPNTLKCLQPNLQLVPLVLSQPLHMPMSALNLTAYHCPRPVVWFFAEHC